MFFLRGVSVQGGPCQGVSPFRGVSVGRPPGIRKAGGAHPSGMFYYFYYRPLWNLKFIAQHKIALIIFKHCFTWLNQCIITAYQRSWGRVAFSVIYVCFSIHGGFQCYYYLIDWTYFYRRPRNLGKVTFSVMPVCISIHEVSNVTITYDTWDFTKQGIPLFRDPVPIPAPCWWHLVIRNGDLFKFFHLRTSLVVISWGRLLKHLRWTRAVVHTPLQWFLVLEVLTVQFSSFFLWKSSEIANYFHVVSKSYWFTKLL